MISWAVLVHCNLGKVPEKMYHGLAKFQGATVAEKEDHFCEIPENVACSSMWLSTWVILTVTLAGYCLHFIPVIFTVTKEGYGLLCLVV